jgi:hypothetical protein
MAVCEAHFYLDTAHVSSLVTDALDLVQTLA